MAKLKDWVIRKLYADLRIDEEEPLRTVEVVTSTLQLLLEEAMEHRRMQFKTIGYPRKQAEEGETWDYIDEKGVKYILRCPLCGERVRLCSDPACTFQGHGHHRDPTAKCETFVKLADCTKKRVRQHERKAPTQHHRPSHPDAETQHKAREAS